MAWALALAMPVTSAAAVVIVASVASAASAAFVAFAVNVAWTDLASFGMGIAGSWADQSGIVAFG